MASDFDPRSSSSGSRNRARSGGASRARRSSPAQKPVKGKRTSVAAKTRKQPPASKAARQRSADRKRRSLDRMAASDALSKDSEYAAREQGVRVGDVRRRERAERAARARARYRRYVLRIVILIVVVLALIFGAIFVYRSDLFLITNVKVNGVSHLTSAEITEIAAVEDGSTLLRLDAAGIVERLEDNAWVQLVTIHRQFPDTLEVDVVERAPGAVVRINDKSKWVISTDGTWLSAATDEDWKSQMRIIDVSNSISDPMSGASCNDGGITNALNILSNISDELKGSIKSISAESSIKTSLNLKDGVTVAFGDSSDVALKESVANELLDKFKGKISYINVRVPSRPTYRTLEG